MQLLSASLALVSLLLSGNLHSIPGSATKYLYAKNMAGSQLLTHTNVCCHKSVQKQDEPLTFNISVLGLLIHYEPVINVAEMQMRVATIPGVEEDATQPQPPGTPGLSFHSRAIPFVFSAPSEF